MSANAAFAGLIENIVECKEDCKRRMLAALEGLIENIVECKAY